MGEEELPEACKICIKLGGGDDANPRYGSDMDTFWPCQARSLGETSVCLPKDRAMIVLHYKILQALEKK